MKNRLRILMAEYQHKTGEKLTQRDLSKHTGIAESTLSAYINNRVQQYDRRVVDTLMDFFGCDFNQFFTRDEFEAAGELLPA